MLGKSTRNTFDSVVISFSWRIANIDTLHTKKIANVRK